MAPHDAWLSDLDLRQEGLAPLTAASVTAAMEGAALANPGGTVAASSPAQVAEAAAHDLQVVKETLVQHAGGCYDAAAWQVSMSEWHAARSRPGQQQCVSATQLVIQLHRRSASNR